MKICILEGLDPNLAEALRLLSRKYYRTAPSQNQPLPSQNQPPPFQNQTVSLEEQWPTRGVDWMDYFPIEDNPQLVMPGGIPEDNMAVFTPPPSPPINQPFQDQSSSFNGFTDSQMDIMHQFEPIFASQESASQSSAWNGFTDSQISNMSQYSPIMSSQESLSSGWNGFTDSQISIIPQFEPFISSQEAVSQSSAWNGFTNSQMSNMSQFSPMRCHLKSQYPVGGMDLLTLR